jgi:hypothetical protein
MRLHGALVKVAGHVVAQGGPALRLPMQLAIFSSRPKDIDAFAMRKRLHRARLTDCR